MKGYDPHFCGMPRRSKVDKSQVKNQVQPGLCSWWLQTTSLFHISAVLLK